MHTSILNEVSDDTKALNLIQSEKPSKIKVYSQLLPSIGFVLIGGTTIGDSVDRRKIILLATNGQTVMSGTFVAQAFCGLG